MKSVSTMLLAIALAALSIPALGQEPIDDRITVVGEGTANVVPDLAFIQAGVTTQGKTARQASDANNTTMTRVLAVLKTGGISERDMQTANFSIRPVYDSRREGENRVSGFQASNQISVRVRDLTKVATVLDQLIAAGANDMSGIDFTVSERSKVADTARAEAVADARRKAEVLVKAAGARLGPATRIVEGGGGEVGPMARPMLRAASATSVPIATGEETLRVHVSVTFELLH